MIPVRATIGLALVATLACSRPAGPVPETAARPNIILCMADDLGWGDVGFNGNERIMTPHLDRLAREGLLLNRFYAASPVCSPTRASFLTGRNPMRLGIHGASRGFLQQDEVTLAEALGANGYATGHFGKWHLGTMTTSIPDGRRGRRPSEAFSPPWLHGFGESFSTETAVPTWDPMDLEPLREHRGGNPQTPTRYWTGPDVYATENLAGDDSRVIVDRVIAFVERNATAGRPFLAVVWFHAPHEPVVAGPDYRKLYDEEMNDEEAAYAGVITAMDEQMGRLRDELRRLGIEHNTLVLFTSDNGSSRRTPGPFRGGKGSLTEGGIRVPALLFWPEKIRGPRATEVAAHTDDLFPTVLDAAGIAVDETVRPIDGVSLMPLIEGRSSKRSRPMAFEFRTQLAYIDPPYKILSVDGGKNFALYNLAEDPREELDLAGNESERLAGMITALESHRASWARSRKESDLR